jgi:hypothetical protein
LAEREKEMSSWRISRFAKSERIMDKRKMAVKKNWWWMKTFGRTRDQQPPDFFINPEIALRYL